MVNPAPANLLVWQGSAVSPNPLRAIPVDQDGQSIRPNFIQARSGRLNVWSKPLCHILSTSQFAISPAIGLLRATLSISPTLVGEYSDFHLATKSCFCFAVRHIKAACISFLNFRRDSRNCLDHTCSCSILISRQTTQSLQLSIGILQHLG